MVRGLRYLLDASALYTMAVSDIEKHAGVLEDSAVLDLTLYEVGNAAFVAWRRGLLRDFEGFIRVFSDLVESLDVVRVYEEDLGGIARVSAELRLTFYDAAYVYKARELGLTLLTRDKEIARKAPDVARLYP